MRTKTQVWLPTPNCDLREGPCLAYLDSGESIELSSIPTNLPALTPVQLKVRAANISTQTVKVHFKGKEIPMGEYQVALSPQHDGSFTARSMLPTCQHAQMAWWVNVMVDTGTQQFCAPFVLINERPNGGWGRH